MIRDVVGYFYAHNIQEYIKLPEIAVTGETSSGKSSLLSAISSIQLPANEKLTTRCPTRLHMSKSNDGSYSAQVLVKWHHLSSYRTEEDKTYCTPD
jgi:ABC-type lipoprotein export system ATPase subunit